MALLCISSYVKNPPVHKFLVFVLILLYMNVSMMVTISASPRKCRDYCGNQEIRYPIGIDPGCGNPQFFMTCTTNSTLQIVLNSKIFTVNNINYNAKTLVLRDPFMSDCNNLYSKSLGWDFNLASTGFTLASDNTILLLGCMSLPQQLNLYDDQYDCHHPACFTFVMNCHHIVTPCCRVTDPGNGINLNPMECLSYTSIIYNPQIPMLDLRSWSYGIKVQWNVPRDTVQTCDACEARKGICGYKTSDLQKFTCICESPHVCKEWASAKTKRIIGISVAAVVLTVAGIITLILQPWQKCRRKQNETGTGNGSRDYLVKHKDSTDMDLAHVLAAMTGPVPLTLFKYQELVIATASFAEDRLLGDGGFGMVYKAEFPDGRIFAVKMLNHLHHRRLALFYNEVRILSQAKHPNLVSLIGFCLEDKDLLLVYEYVCNGTLEEHIHEGRGDTKLPWEARLDIACDVAEALVYLHFGISPPIYHRDVKSSNILLDDKLKAKIADFGLSRLVPMAVSHVSTGPQGTPGYVDPEYHQCYQVTDKSDVFSFGVVLMELISSKRAVDITRPFNEVNLSSYAISKIQNGQFEELVDPLFHQNMSTAKKVAELAFTCIASNRQDRPNMKTVLSQLESIRLATKSTNSFSSKSIRLATKSTDSLSSS